MLFFKLRHTVSQQSALPWITTVFLLLELFPIWWVPGHWRDMEHGVSYGVLSLWSGQQTWYASAVLPGMDSHRPGPGIAPSSAEGKKLPWPRRNVTGNHFAVKISDWKPAWLWNELVRRSPNLLAKCSHGLLLPLIISFSKRNRREIKYPLSTMYYHWELHNWKFLVSSVQGRDGFGTSHPFLSNMLMH